MCLPSLSHAHLLYHTARRSNRLLKSPDSLPLSLEYLFAIHTARDDEEDELAIGSIFSLAEGLHLQFCRRKRFGNSFSMDVTHGPPTTDVENPPMRATEVDPTRDLENPPNRPLPVGQDENLEIEPDMPPLETIVPIKLDEKTIVPLKFRKRVKKVNQYLLGFDMFGAFVLIVSNNLLEKCLEEIEENEADRHRGRDGSNGGNNGHNGQGPPGEMVEVDDTTAEGVEKVEDEKKAGRGGPNGGNNGHDEEGPLREKVEVDDTAVEGEEKVDDEEKVDEKQNIKSEAQQHLVDNEDTGKAQHNDKPVDNEELEYTVSEIQEQVEYSVSDTVQSNAVKKQNVESEEQFGQIVQHIDNGELVYNDSNGFKTTEHRRSKVGRKGRVNHQPGKVAMNVAIVCGTAIIVMVGIARSRN
ncbi:unnamed protein product [Camellia sinensis]